MNNDLSTEEFVVKIELALARREDFKGVASLLIEKAHSIVCQTMNEFLSYINSFPIYGDGTSKFNTFLKNGISHDPFEIMFNVKMCCLKKDYFIAQIRFYEDFSNIGPDKKIPRDVLFNRAMETLDIDTSVIKPVSIIYTDTYFDVNFRFGSGTK